MDAKETEAIILQYTEAVFGYCIKRLNNIQDAQDLSQEILLECLRALSSKADILNLEAYIWKVAHNRYARRLNNQKSTVISLEGSGLDMCLCDYSDFDSIEHEDMKQAVFKAVVGIAKSHRDILVDYYVKELSYSDIAAKRSIPVNTVKTRLYYGKQKLRERFDKVMDGNQRVYERINWHIMSNGHMNPNKYLDKQINRAICSAAYNRPLSIEEISEVTGIPCMYIEDEMNGLIYGDAIERIGDKFQTTFIIHSKEMMDKTLALLDSNADEISKKLLERLKEFEARIRDIAFYGSNFPMEHLLWLLIPITIRGAVYQARKVIPEIHYGTFPLRKDGGYGYFVVQESETERVETNSGCNSYSNGERWDKMFNFLWWGRHFFNNINNILPRAVNMNFSNGVFDFSLLTEEDLALLIKHNLIFKNSLQQYCWNIPVVTEESYQLLEHILNEIGLEFVQVIADVAEEVYLLYQKHVPKRLYSQISGVMGGEIHRIIGLIIEKFISAGYLNEPCGEYFSKQVLMIYR